MDEGAFIEQAMRILKVATADGTPPEDAIAVTVKALATLIVVTSRGDAVSFEELLKATLTSVASLAMDGVSAGGLRQQA